MKQFPNDDIAVSVVWIQMPGFNDNETTATNRAKEIHDQRITHFYDPFPAHTAGKIFAQGVVSRGPAWDIYFFYEPGASWTDLPPSAVAWWHQLGGDDRADPTHFAAGVLEQRLIESMKELRSTAP